MGAPRPFFLKGNVLTDVYEQERTLYREVAQRVEQGVPGVEVLAVELLSSQRFCVYVDHPGGVDHALCERVSGLLRAYLDRFTVDVSSPGFERPLRKPAHFAGVVGRKVSLRTADEVAGKKRFRGEVVSAGDRTLSVATGSGESVEIPYDAIVRANLMSTPESR
jgi:ribosome maturation factor RimP